MAVMIDNADMPDILRGLRLVRAKAQEDAEKAKGTSYHLQLEATAKRLDEKIAQYELALRMAQE